MRVYSFLKTKANNNVRRISRDETVSNAPTGQRVQTFARVDIPDSHSRVSIAGDENVSS